MTACNFATLNQLAPARVIMGIGTGNTSRRTLGMPAAKLVELRTHIEVCRGLWKRETVAYEGGDRRQQIRFLDPDAELINLCRSNPGLYCGSISRLKGRPGPKGGCGRARQSQRARALGASHQG